MALANEAANEVVSGIRVVRSFNTEKLEAHRYDDHLMDTHNLKTRRDTVRAVYLLAQRVRNLFACCGLCLSLRGDYLSILHHLI